MKSNSKYRILSGLRQSQSDGTLRLPDVTADKLNYTDVETDNNMLLERFHVTLEQLHGEFYNAKTAAKAQKILKSLLSDFPDNGCLANNFRLLQHLIANDKELKKKIDYTSKLSMSSEDFARYQGGITHADYLIARSGSVVVTSLSGGGRRLSILPPVHIVLAHLSQLVPSIEDVWRNLSNRPLACSSLSIISGPSRTSDIEKELVLGAHGPRRLVVIIVDDTYNK